MSEFYSYEEATVRAASRAIEMGYDDSANLKRLLILTTSTTTEPMVMCYLREHLGDERLLNTLVAIALDREDEGDAPWAAANVIAEFPRELLTKHRRALEVLAAEEWLYFHIPARRALAKIDQEG